MSNDPTLNPAELQQLYALLESFVTDDGSAEEIVNFVNTIILARLDAQSEGN